MKMNISKFNTNDDLFSSVFFLALFGILSCLACFKYVALHSTYLDMGIFVSTLNHVFSGELWQVSYLHVQPYLLLWSGLYSIFPAGFVPIVILIIQSGLLALPALWLYRLYGPFYSFAYALYFPLWFNALFDFHIDHMAIMFLFGFFILAKKDHIKTAVFAALLIAFVKESFALQTAACGLFLLVEKKKGPGIFLIVSGLLYFIFATYYLLPFFMSGGKGGLDFSGYSWMGDSTGEIIRFIVMKPHMVLWAIISDSKKIKFIICVFGALGFIPFLKPKYLIPALPILFISLISETESYYGIGHHYTAGLIAPLIMGFCEGNPVARKIWSRLRLSGHFYIPTVFLGILMCHIVLSPSPISRLFWLPKVWSYHYSAYIPSDRDSMIKKAIVAHVPKTPEVFVITQNSLSWGHIMNRKYSFCFPYGVFEPLKSPDLTLISYSDFISYLRNNKLPLIKNNSLQADYILLDLNRPWYIGDKGCDWYYGECHNEEISEEFTTLVEKTKENYKIIYENDEFIILKKNLNKQFMPSL